MSTHPDGRPSTPPRPPPPRAGRAAAPPRPRRRAAAPRSAASASSENFASLSTADSTRIARLGGEVADGAERAIELSRRVAVRRAPRVYPRTVVRHEPPTSGSGIRTHCTSGGAAPRTGRGARRRRSSTPMNSFSERATMPTASAHGRGGRSDDAALAAILEKFQLGAAEARRRRREAASAARHRPRRRTDRPAPLRRRGVVVVEGARADPQRLCSSRSRHGPRRARG